MFYTELNLTRKVSKTEENNKLFFQRKLLRFISVHRKLLGKPVFSTSSHQHFSLRRSDKLLLAQTFANPCDCSVWGWG